MRRQHLKHQVNIWRKMYMKYRLKVNVCGKRIIGRVVYNSYIEAQIRQEELRLNGIESKVVDSIGGDAE